VRSQPFVIRNPCACAAGEQSHDHSRGRLSAGAQPLCRALHELATGLIERNGEVGVGEPPTPCAGSFAS
jgi:hypothetical protein